VNIKSLLNFGEECKLKVIDVSSILENRFISKICGANRYDFVIRDVFLKSEVIIRMMKYEEVLLWNCSYKSEGWKYTQHLTENVLQNSVTYLLIYGSLNDAGSSLDHIKSHFKMKNERWDFGEKNPAHSTVIYSIRAISWQG